MKLMTDIKMLDFVEGISFDEIPDTERTLNRAFCGDVAEGWLDRGFKSGHFKVTTAHLAGRPLYRYVWHRNDQDYLHINGAVFVGEPGTGDDGLFLVGIVMIARQNDCKGITIVSRRRGMIEQCQRAGFKVGGIMMERSLENVSA